MKGKYVVSITANNINKQLVEVTIGRVGSNLTLKNKKRSTYLSVILLPNIWCSRSCFSWATFKIALCFVWPIRHMAREAITYNKICSLKTTSLLPTAKMAFNQEKRGLMSPVIKIVIKCLTFAKLLWRSQIVWVSELFSHEIDI